MKNILIFLLTVFITTTIWAGEVKKLEPVKKDVKEIEKTSENLKLKVQPKVIAKEAKKGEVLVPEQKKLDDSSNKVGTEEEAKKEDPQVVEEKKYESKTFVLNSKKQTAKSLGTYYLKGNLALPENFKVEDVPNDGGGVIEITWEYHSKNNPEKFELLRKSSKEEKFSKIKDFDASFITYSYKDKTNKVWESYEYKVEAGSKSFIVIPSINKRKEAVASWKFPAKTLPKKFIISRRVIAKYKEAVKTKKDFKLIGSLESPKNVTYSFRNNSLNDDLSYEYKVRVKKDGLYAETKAKKVSSEAAWFDMKKLVMLLAGIFLVFAIVFFIRMARSGKELYIRRIAGLDAVDDAVGRATEMGREIMFVPGITDIDDPQTIAGLTILGRVAKLTAQYKTPLSVPVSRSMVMITGREIVKESYLSAGRPENFQDGMIYYLTDDQFGFAAGVDGIMVREKPATIFLQGAFYAESLILAETGHHIGAIQISGTAAPSQLPFFITACDYTLMGEELYAASAYLSREPQLLGSLRGQDAGKAMILLAITVGIILETASYIFDMPGLSIKEFFELK